MIHYPCLDIIRVCACFLVILLHTADVLFGHFSPAWKYALFWDSFSRMSVPLFFMLSGFLLLDARIDSLGRFYYRRYTRILLPFTFICLLYYFTPMYAGYTPPGYLEYISCHFVDYHLWYIYALIGLYLTLPFFIKILRGSEGRKLSILYALIWAGSFTLLPLLTGKNLAPAEIVTLQTSNPDYSFGYAASDLFVNFFINYDFIFFYGYMGYFVAAWLIKHSLSNFPAWFYWFCLGLCVVATTAMLFLTRSFSLAKGLPDQTWFNNLTPFVALQAIPFFIFLCRFQAETPLIRDLSDKSYWIYLLHLFLLRFFYGLWQLPESWPSAILIPLYAIVIFITAYFAAIPLRAIELRLLKILRVA